MGIRLSRNFGAHPALAAGLDDVELELRRCRDPCLRPGDPRKLCRFVAAWREGAQVVWGARRRRAELGCEKSYRAAWRRAATFCDRTTTQIYSAVCTDGPSCSVLPAIRRAPGALLRLVAWPGFDGVVNVIAARAPRQVRLDAAAPAGYHNFMTSSSAFRRSRQSE